MSKFGPLLEYLDKKNKIIKKREFPQGVTPLNPQEICIIPLKIPEINPMCEKCIYSALINMQGQINELGIGGYMSNQKDPLESTVLRPSEGIKLREPHTLIVGQGQVWACRNRIMGQRGVFILTKEAPPCDQFKEKLKEKK